MAGILAISMEGQFYNINYSMLGYVLTFRVDILKYCMLIMLGGGSTENTKPGSGQSPLICDSGHGRWVRGAPMD